MYIGTHASASPSCTFRMASHVFISLYIIASDIPHLLLQLLWLNSACCSDHTQHIALLFTNIRKMVCTVATSTPCMLSRVYQFSPQWCNAASRGDVHGN